MANDSDVDSSILKRDDLRRSSPLENGTMRSQRSEFEGTATEPRTESSDNRSSEYHERLLTPRYSRSGTEIRIVNPAIYAESIDAWDVEAEETASSRENGKTTNFVVEVRCGDTDHLVDRLSSLSVNDAANYQSPCGLDSALDETNADTYRCSRSDTSHNSTLTLINNPGPVRRVVRRCAIKESSTKYTNGHRAEIDGDGEVRDRDTDGEVKRYAINGRKVVHFSSTSLTASSCFGENKSSGLLLARKLAHEEWVRKKKRAAELKKDTVRRSEIERRHDEDQIEKEREERERKEHENFARWQERKRKEEANRRLVFEREVELQRRLKALEDRAAIAKMIHLQRWARKKEEARKAQQREQQLKRKAMEDERRKRIEESSKAFDKWREMAKSKPRPATQGLLPHQRAKPSFVNPKPWQMFVDESVLESPANLTDNNEVMAEHKDDTRKRISSHQ